MEYKLENEHLLVRVNSVGAELRGVFDKRAEREMMWRADTDVWGSCAPLLFPYCGRMKNLSLNTGGRTYPATPHGFAYTTEFVCIEQDSTRLLMRLEANEETRMLYPFAFVLDVEFVLDANHLYQTVRVKNSLMPGKTGGQPCDGVLPFSVGFHPGFALPLRDGLLTDQHELVFDKEENPREIMTPAGYVSGDTRPRFTGQQQIGLTDDLFDNDSICLAGLHSKSIALREKGRQVAVRVRIEGFPYTLIWSKATEKLHFICIEPWHGLPDGEQENGKFEDKAGIIRLPQGECFETTLALAFEQGQG